ncbi:MAG: hypothetical protein IT324_30585 [Anaerolineae bacterium]|nr:hypothetical protein [Anaerolineae bacterium]
MRTIKALAGLLAIVTIGAAAWMFLVFPRVANMLADLLGTNPEEPTHWVPALIITAILLLIAYFWVLIPYRMYRSMRDDHGLIVQRGQGRAFMDTESARQQVYAAVARIPNVQRTEVTIGNELGRAAVTMNILADNTINGPKKKQEISREVKKVIQDQLGIQLAGEPTINMSLEPIGAEVPHAAPAAGSNAGPAPLQPKSLPPRSVSYEPPVAKPEPRAEPVRPLPPIERRAPDVIRPQPPVEAPIETRVEPPAAAPVTTPTETIETVTTTTEEPALPTSDDATPVTTMRPFVRRPFVPPGGARITTDEDKPAEDSTTRTELPDLPDLAANNDENKE